ncbi:hypothetical protein QUW58_13070 [Enterocloster aldenensis]|uniref:DUF6809 family protein n=1 Tax=Enterocloster aldenensis TaxID=358742 RepID=UPI0025A42F32|nr:hypothetical protein [Enterocloster aldenensis]
MGKILDALADDNLCINPTIYKGSPKYMKAVDTLFKTSEALEAKLNDEEKEIFEQFCDANSDENHISEVDKFVRGYRLGALMMFEVFAGKDDFILDKGANE